METGPESNLRHIMRLLASARSLSFRISRTSRLVFRLANCSALYAGLTEKCWFNEQFNAQDKDAQHFAQ